MSVWAQTIYYDYRDAGGDWQTRTVGNRIALVAGNRGQMGYFDIKVPQDGYYKIYAYVMHRWNNSWPLIETRILQAAQIYQEGSFTAEPGKLSHQGTGRWLIKSTDNGEEPYLKKGTARVEFRLNSRDKIRIKAEGKMENEVYLWCFIVVPRTGESGNLMNVLEAERGTGDWETVEYLPEEQCGIVESIAGGRFRLKVHVPQAGDYQFAALLRSEAATEIRVAVSKDKERFGKPLQITIDRDGFWKIQSLFIRKFSKGTYFVEIENKTSNKIWIDSFLLVPHIFSKDEADFTLSCSTVFFYHNKGARNLSEGITKIIKAGFPGVDIVAYDGKVGFGDDITDVEVIRIQKLLTRLNGRAASVHFGYISLHTVEEAIDRVRWALWIAQLLDAKRIVAPVSLDVDGDTFLSKEEGLVRLSSAINRVKPLLEQTGVELGLENHADRQWLFRVSDDFLSARKLLSKKVTFVLDEGHFSFVGEDPKTVFKQLLPYSRYVHFKSRDMMHVKSLTKILHSYGYGKDVSLEVEDSGHTLSNWFKMYKKGLSLQK